MISEVLLFLTLIFATISRRKAQFTIDKKVKENNNIVKEYLDGVIHYRQDQKNNLNLNEIEEYLDGVIHYRQDQKNNLNLNEIEDIEKDFRRLIAMKGVKYVYKRDMYWRTWRQVIDTDGVQKMVNYKCNHQIKENSSVCDNCGLWTIEDIVPCPYELFSIKDKYSMCGHHYLQPKNYTNPCPSIVKFSDLSPTCDNPMETSWRFITDFSVHKENSTVLCHDKDYCEFSTVYLITPGAVIFRIINTSNIVIYSKIMKNDNINYICVQKCGQYDPAMKKMLQSNN